MQIPDPESGKSLLSLCVLFLTIYTALGCRTPSADAPFSPTINWPGWRETTRTLYILHTDIPLVSTVLRIKASRSSPGLIRVYVERHGGSIAGIPLGVRSEKWSLIRWSTFFEKMSVRKPNTTKVVYHEIVPDFTPSQFPFHSLFLSLFPIFPIGTDRRK